MAKYHPASNQRIDEFESSQSESIQLVSIHDALITVTYPYNVEIAASFLSDQDQLLQQTYHSYHGKKPQLLIKLDGISDITTDAKQYINQKSHHGLYSSVGFVLSKGDMSVLERHYLEQLLSFQLRNNRRINKQDYTVGIFTSELAAKIWLASRPGSNHRH